MNPITEKDLAEFRRRVNERLVELMAETRPSTMAEYIAREDEAIVDVLLGDSE